MSIWFGNLFIHDNHVFICYSTTVEEQVAYGGKVVGESAMVNAEDIGNEVIHKYFVSTLICFVISFMSENCDRMTLHGNVYCGMSFFFLSGFVSCNLHLSLANPRKSYFKLNTFNDFKETG